MMHRNFRLGPVTLGALSLPMEKGKCSLILALVLLLLLSSCARLIKYELDHVMASGDQATYLVYTNYLFWRDVRVRSRLVGDLTVDLKKMILVDELTFKYQGLTWEIETTPDLEEFARKSVSIIQHYIFLSADQLAVQNFHEGFDLTIRIGLVPEQANVDHVERSRFVSSPTLHYIFPVNPASSDTWGRSIILALDTIQHELVHFGARLGKLVVPGSTSRQRVINEEIFAYIIGTCHRYVLLNNFYSDPPTLMLPRPTIDGRTASIEAMLDELESYGPSVFASFVAYLLVHSGAPLEKALDQQEFDLLLDHCEQITQYPRDYVASYLENGVPDAWQLMVTNHEQ
jgi:hypothetical protein